MGCVVRLCRRDGVGSGWLFELRIEPRLLTFICEMSGVIADQLLYGTFETHGAAHCETPSGGPTAPHTTAVAAAPRVKAHTPSRRDHS